MFCKKYKNVIDHLQERVSFLENLNAFGDKQIIRLSNQVKTLTDENIKHQLPKKKMKKIAKSPLKPRDEIILELDKEGLTSYQIADRIGCHRSTVSRTLKRCR